MARPLQGTRRRVPDGHYRALPTVRGGTSRTGHTFVDEARAEAWLAAGIAALQRGEPLPVPAAVDVVGSRPRARAGGTPFQRLADRWESEHYEELRRAGASRQTTVRGHIRTIADWMTENGYVLETMTREPVKQMFASFARRSPDPAPQVPEGLDPDALVTMDEAASLPLAPSKSTLKRRKQEGLLPPRLREDGRMAYRVADIYSRQVGGGDPAGLRRGPRREHGLAQEVLQDIRWVYEEICLYARDHGIEVPDDRRSLKLHITDRPQSPKRQSVALADCAAIAGRMHAVHQIVLWLMRILGLRISEAYGIRVCDLDDHGPARPGILVIRAQGGRAFKIRNRLTGEVELEPHLDSLKTENSYRVLVVPTALMNVLRTVIRIFHTAPDGTIRTDARLVPGLVRVDEGGQAAFRTALHRAAVAAGVRVEENDEDATFSCTPHDMRRSLISELNWRKVEAAHRRRFAGHTAGDDVHHRHYVLDDPLLRPAREIATLIQQIIDDEVPGGLAVPTLLRCTTGAQPALAQDGERIDAELAEAGWLALPDADGDPLLAASDVARELEVTVQTARRWMATGRVPSVHWADRAYGEERRARLWDVLRIKTELKRQVTVAALADELGQSYHAVYQYMRAQQLPLQWIGQREYAIPEQIANLIRVHYREQDALHRRAVPLAVAATTLGTSVPAVIRLIETGVLIADDRAHDGRRMVTRDSLGTARQSWSGHRRRMSISNQDGSELMSWSEAEAMTGLTAAELESLCASGTLERRQHNRRRHLTRRSVLLYLVDVQPHRFRIE